MNIGLLIILVTVFISYQGFKDVMFFEKYNFNPYRIKRHGEYYRFLTHGFLHSNQMHLIFNMLTLYFVQLSLGKVYGDLFLPFYIFSIVTSTLYEFFKNQNQPYYRACGASGAVAAALFSLLIFAPWGRVYVFFIVPVSFLMFAILYMVYSITQLQKQGEKIAHSVHIMGAIIGVVTSIVLFPAYFQNFINEIIHFPGLGILIFGQ